MLYIIPMKVTGLHYLGLTTLVLVTLAIMVFYNIPFSIVFFTTIAGQILLVFTVYKVLTDDYTTDKTFDDWYEDYPFGRDQ